MQCPKCHQTVRPNVNVALPGERTDLAVHLRNDCPIDYAIFVPAWICRHPSSDPLREVEVGSERTLDAAIERAKGYQSARVVEAWQSCGLYRYGRVMFEHGPYLDEWRLPVEPFVGGHRRG